MFSRTLITVLGVLKTGLVAKRGHLALPKEVFPCQTLARLFTVHLTKAPLKVSQVGILDVYIFFLIWRIICFPLRGGLLALPLFQFTLYLISSLQRFPFLFLGIVEARFITELARLGCIEH